MEDYEKAIRNLEDKLTDVSRDQQIIMTKLEELQPLLEHINNFKVAGKVGKVLLKIVTWFIAFAASMSSIIAAYYVSRG